MKVALLAAAALAVASPAFAASTTFADPEMLLSSYSFTTYKEPGFTTDIYQDQGSGFGLDRSIALYYLKTGPTSPNPRFQAMSTTFVYDPSSQGAITTIDTSLEFLIGLYYNNNPVGLTAGHQLRLLALQDGNLYEAFRTLDTTPLFNQWGTASVAGFGAADFLKFDPLDPYAARTETGLDFAGGAIRFGFEVVPYGVLVGGGPATGNTGAFYRVDNFSVTVNSLGVTGPGAVPEPATWAMMIVGFGLAGTAVRRRRTLAA